MLTLPALLDRRVRILLAASPHCGGFSDIVVIPFYAQCTQCISNESPGTNGISVTVCGLNTGKYNECARSAVHQKCMCAVCAGTGERCVYFSK